MLRCAVALVAVRGEDGFDVLEIIDRLGRARSDGEENETGDGEARREETRAAGELRKSHKGKFADARRIFTHEVRFSTGA